MRELDLSADVISVSDITDCVEELETQRDENEEPVDGENADERDYRQQLHDEAVEELATLEAILDELRGRGGNHQWRGDWYPDSLIAESYWTDYVEDLCKDCGVIPRDMPQYLVIDWQATGENIKADYTSIDVEGKEYWYR